MVDTPRQSLILERRKGRKEGRNNLTGVRDKSKEAGVLCYSILPLHTHALYYIVYILWHTYYIVAILWHMYYIVYILWHTYYTVAILWHTYYIVYILWHTYYTVAIL